MNVQVWWALSSLTVVAGLSAGGLLAALSRDRQGLTSPVAQALASVAMAAIVGIAAIGVAAALH